MYSTDIYLCQICHQGNKEPQEPLNQSGGTLSGLKRKQPPLEVNQDDSSVLQPTFPSTPAKRRKCTSSSSSSLDKKKLAYKKLVYTNKRYIKMLKYITLLCTREGPIFDDIFVGNCEVCKEFGFYIRETRNKQNYFFFKQSCCKALICEICNQLCKEEDMECVVCGSIVSK